MLNSCRPDATVRNASMDDEEDLPDVGAAPNDLLDNVAALPDAAPPFTSSSKYTRLFALDVGAPGHDQYVYVLPNGLCVVGLAPSHAFLKNLQPPPATTTNPPPHEQASALGVHGNPHATIVVPDATQEADPASVQGTTAPAPCQPSHASHVSDLSQAQGNGVQAHAQSLPQTAPAADLTTASVVRKRKAPDPDDATPQNPGNGMPNSEPSARVHAEETDTMANTDPAAKVHAEGTGTSVAVLTASAASHTQPTSHAASPTVSHPEPSGAAGAALAASQPAPHIAAGPAVPGTIVGTSGLTVSFDVGRRDASVKQSGKKRTQGAQLDSNAVLCVLTDGSGNSVRVRPVASGKLLEVNQRLTTQPHLLVTRPCREGYLAILFPGDQQLVKLKETLCPCDRYLQQRGLKEEDLW